MKRTPQEYLDEVAMNKFGTSGFVTHLTFVEGIDKVNKTHALVLEAMQRAIEDACREQRELCAENARVKTTFKLTDKTEVADAVKLLSGYVTSDKDSILNAPSPTFKK